MSRTLKTKRKFLSSFPIKYEAIENLLDITGELLSNLNPDTGHQYEYRFLAESSERDSKNVVDKLMHFDQLDDEHAEKFLRGEVHYSSLLSEVK